VQPAACEEQPSRGGRRAVEVAEGPAAAHGASRVDGDRGAAGRAAAARCGGGKVKLNHHYGALKSGHTDKNYRRIRAKKLSTIARTKRRWIRKREKKTAQERGREGESS
jgi:hypothetical protein